ncbi:MAG: type II toxin-antitoxin system HicA family toxin [Phycisphaerales bacterium]|nr:type II toxin-antitoxin system HicA family toxin [Phycisphaerales bacterium]
MGSRLPVISGADAVRAFGKIGYAVHHHTGSHVIIRRSEPPHRHLSVPNHKELARGLLRGLIRDAGLTLEQFIALLD